MRILIQGARLVDPTEGIDGITDVALSDGLIEATGADAGLGNFDRIVEAAGQILLPGLFDCHVHLREPGYEYKETIRTGTRSAVAGGVTGVACMPNTRPPNDNAAITQFIMRKARDEGHCTVVPVGAVTVGQKGEQLAPMGELVEAGCRAFSDDGFPVHDSLLMRRALEYSRIFDVPIIGHEEDLRLAEGGVMNEGPTATALGLQGIPSAAEEVMVARDLALVELTGGKLHLAHISSAGSVVLIRQAKARGIAVTAETCPHYFSLTDDAVAGYDTEAKVNPPLRTIRDVDAVREGLRDGTLDIIVTDHAPHHREEKGRAFDEAPPGISGLETLLPLSWSLVRDGVMDIGRLVESLSVRPRRLLGLDPVRVVPGRPAELVLFDPEAEWVVRPEEFHSQGKNTPFRGMTLRGRVTATFFGDRIYEGGASEGAADGKDERTA